jgi:tricorn protease
MKLAKTLIRGSLLLALPLLAQSLLAQSRLLRFPDIQGDTVVFTYGGDLWKAPVAGGTATRLTAHPGLELFAKFSPDGQWIAFTGQYDGDEQVYVMPAGGGAPRQLTYYPAKGPLPARWGYDNQVYGWTPDGSAILYRSVRDGWSVAQSRLYKVPVQGGLGEPLPMPSAGAGDYSPDGGKVLYSPLFRDFRTWKRYEGGWAQDLFVFDLKTSAIEPVSNSKRTERDPMWIGGKVYYASDRTGTLNLFEYDPATKKARQLTSFTDWDVRWPSASPEGKIVFELDGELQVLDVKAGGAPRKIRISVPTDGLNARPSQMNVGGQVSDMGLSPKGERALFVARGDIFSAPIEKGVPRNLTRSSGAHDKAAAWSPDGRWIAFLSDMSGEEELYIVPQDGSAKPTQLTSGGKAMRYNPQWSPDAKKIAFSDKDGKVYVVTVADKSMVEVADDPRGQVTDYEWSPDSSYLAYSLSDQPSARSIYIWSAAENKARRVTGAVFSERTPSWDPEGNYLFYLSDREYQPLISSVEFNFATTRTTSVFALALRKDTKHPFPPESDEVTMEGEKKAEAPAKKEGAWLKIDFDGIESRAAASPIAASNLFGLVAVKGGLVYSKGGNFYYGRGPDAPNSLVFYTLKDRKENVLLEGAGGWTVSQDGSKVLVRQGGGISLMDVKPGAGASKKTVSTAGLVVERVPSQEWAQIFNEVWRRYRDFFYVKNMHGYDWEALRRQYAPQLEYIGHRADLNYIIGEMISELNVGHAYIDGGDLNLPARPRVALPGARFTLDAAAGRYRIAKIYRGQNEEATYRSPLTEVGVSAAVGDYVLAIDGEELSATTNPYRLLRGKAGRTVRLTVNSKADREGARDIDFQPVDDETDLNYLEMVLANQERVEKASGGRLGYIHVPDMGANGIREFIKWYYPQIRKEGLVVDMRGNGGGNVSRMLIERLRRTVLATNFSRTNDEVGTYPDGVFHGSLVCLLNENSASDGDIFPAMFRQAKLGPLVGKRSWGGVVGISNRGTLIDGGVVNVPEFGFANPEGQWVIEGVGVEPDIVVENDPKSLIEGRDPQLERGIAEVLKAMQANPKRLPNRPPDPVKTKEAVAK